MKTVRKGWLIVLSVGLGLILLGIVAKSFILGKGGLGALQVVSVPKATVLIDGIQVGLTPYFDDKIKTGEHTVKLIPASSAESLGSWEAKINVSPNVLTVINRIFGTAEFGSSGEVVSLERISSRKKAALSVVSIPDQAMVKVNGEPKGFSPTLVEDLPPGDYEVAVSLAPKYEEKIITPKLLAGYKLTINVELARKTEEPAELTGTPTPSPKTSPKTTPSPTLTPKTTPSVAAKPYIKVKKTGVFDAGGKEYLNVRAAPSREGEILTKIYSEETYPYLNETKSGWWKIEYETGKEGWVSGTYVELVR